MKRMKTKRIGIVLVTGGDTEGLRVFVRYVSNCINLYNAEFTAAGGMFVCKTVEIVAL